MTKDQSVTTWALIGTTAIGAAGWVTTTMRDRRTADASIVTAASELVSALTAEIGRLRAEVDDVRSQVALCEERHAEVIAQMASLSPPRVRES